MAVLENVPPAPEVLSTGQPVPGPPGAPPRRWKWTGDDLIRMGEAGLLPPEGRFELLDGEIYELMPPGPLHDFIVDEIGDLLEALARQHGAFVREEKSIRLTAEYEPQPDLAILRGPKREYRGRRPAPEDVLLVVEVADSSLDHDWDLKLPAYAAQGIPECWIVNLLEQQVEVYREPDGAGYRLRRIYRSGETIEPLGTPGGSVAGAALLGEPEPGEGAEPTSGE